MKDLCQLAGDWTGTMPPAGLAVEEKIDGWRALYTRGLDGVPRLYTRNGQTIPGAEHILYRLAEFEQAAGAPLFIDGEFQVGGTLDATKRWCESEWRMGGTAGVFYAFDVMPFADWQRGGWARPWQERKRLLVDLSKQVNQAPAWDWRPGSFGADEHRPTVGILMEAWAFDALDLAELAAHVWARGGEGLMLKDPSAPYLRQRNRNWLKLKRREQFARAA